MAKDPYRYFRIEADELLEGLSRGLLALEKAPSSDTLRALLRHAHTLKGAARVVKQPEIGDLAHHLEDLLSPHRESGGPLAGDVITAASADIDRMRALLARLQASVPAVVTGASPEPPAEETQQTLRVRIDEMDQVIEGVLRAARATARLGIEARVIDEAVDDARALARASAREPQLGRASASLDLAHRLVERLERVQLDVTRRVGEATAELSELRERVSDLRLVDSTTLLEDLERSARDAARTLGKEVQFRGAGGSTEIDAHVSNGLRSALRHVVRNAVAHGVEDAQTRVAAGKPRAGIVEVAIERRGHRVAVACEDDGCGLDIVQLRRLAVERGLVPPAAVHDLPEARLVELLFRGGLSTTRAPTSISGRGVGLDVVRDTVQQLEGEVSVRTAPGRGTRVEVVVPISLSSIPALPLRFDGATAYVPLDAVRRTIRLRDATMSPSGDGRGIVVDGDVVPLVSLRRALARENGHDGAARIAVVVESGTRRAALLADDVGGVRNVVVRSAPSHLRADPVVGGLTSSDEGHPEVVLSTAALMEIGASATTDLDPSEKASRPRLLVIDDSLTTRMLEQSILESAGYEVDLAASAEEGLRLRPRAPLRRCSSSTSRCRA